MKNIKILLLAFLLPLAGCQNFLDEEPGNMLPMDDAIETVKDCEDFLVGVYSAFKNTGGVAMYGTLAPDLQTDLMNIVQGNSQNFASFHNWNFNSQNSEVSTIWSTYYTVIFRANYCLEGIEKVKTSVTEALAKATSEEKIAELESDLLKLERYQAECCMARAYCRVELVKLFADAYDPATASTQLALPVWDQSKVGTPARATMEKYYEAVLKDLKIAERLPKSVPDTIGFTLGAVRALQTRVYAYMENWPAVISTATDLINNYGYTLLDACDVDDPLRTPYAKMWSEDRGNEIIWKVGYSSTDENLGSLGALFCGLDGTGRFYPDYMPSTKLVQLYVQADMRSQIFLQKMTTQQNSVDIQLDAFTKYPGNTSLNYTEGVNRYVNMPKIFRLSEIYLWRAEAYYHENEPGLANADLNGLRRMRIVNYVDETHEGDKLWQQIKNERMRELCMEGHRLYDLKRYGEGFARKAQNGGVPASYSVSVEPSNPRFTWPIPKKELDVPNSQMVGNPSNQL